MNNKIVLLSMAVIAVGMFAMPSTLSLFAGQHTFKNVSDVASDNGCRKCHEDVYEEMHDPDNTVHWNIPGVKGTNDVFRCNECHNATLNFTYNYLYNNAPPGTRPSAHAAQTVACLECHGNASAWTPGSSLSAASNPMHRLANKYYKGPQSTLTWDQTTCGQCHLDAGNPNSDNYIMGVDTKITGTEEAHGTYYDQSKYPDNQSDIRLKDANTACIGCHTHTAINITWTRSTGYNMVSNGTSGAWVIDFSMNSSTINKTSAGS